MQDESFADMAPCGGRIRLDPDGYAGSPMTSSSSRSRPGASSALGRPVIEISRRKSPTYMSARDLLPKIADLGHREHDVLGPNPGAL
jgi:hypothetical protein